jgi:hypothetical protein
MFRTRRPPPSATVRTSRRHASTGPQSTIEPGNHRCSTCSESAAKPLLKVALTRSPDARPSARAYPQRCQAKAAILASSETLPRCPGRAPSASPEGGGLSQGTVLSPSRGGRERPSSNCNRESAAPRVILLPLAIRQTKSPRSIASDAQKNCCAGRALTFS